ncbi:upstream stimulatory factor 1-like [Dipodomys spectabilis]|uniref:upstream stimulatory factor 1-like n=1 Tax=Dipodomys spectabilis TaxID=105255 RepID=UPI001C53967D|nr:upstream stimulatory factor 1-like [Dipodomys spectabilis]
MKGQQRAAEAGDKAAQVHKGAVVLGKDPAGEAMAGLYSAASFPVLQVRYVFKANHENQLTSRVAQVSEGQVDGQTKGPGTISGHPDAQPTTHAAIQTAFTSDAAADTKETAVGPYCTYFLSLEVEDRKGGTTSGSTAATVSRRRATPPFNGPLLMTSPQEVLGGSLQSVVPRSHPYYPKPRSPWTTQDVERRIQHNKVERRCQDKINSWIMELAKIIPDCSMEYPKSGPSKAGILSKAWEYIQELRQSNQWLSEETQGLVQLQLDNDDLRQQVEDLKTKNLLLRAQLQHHGLEVMNDSNLQGASSRGSCL